jgi:hypothetical protein
MKHLDNPLQLMDCSFGADPELFIQKNGVIAESGDILPREGIENKNGAKITRDGVQVEFNPVPSHCRAVFSTYLASSFRLLKAQLGKDYSASFTGVIELSKEELEKLSADARRLGCAPSSNIHPSTVALQESDSLRTRSAGGHLHFGTGSCYCYSLKDLKTPISPAKIDPAVLVPLFDILVGNTAVIMDPDPAQKERRKFYGRAGEYRQSKAHRIEYRTPSNFWLRSYPLMSFMMGLGRLAISVYYSGLAEEVRKLVDLEKAAKAINENDPVLAWENFLKLKPFVDEFLDSKQDRPIEERAAYNTTAGYHPLTPESQYQRRRYVERLEKSDAPIFPILSSTWDDVVFFLQHPMSLWFPDEPLTYWTEKYKPNLNHSTGWEEFLIGAVRPLRLNDEAKRRLEERDMKQVASLLTQTRFYQSQNAAEMATQLNAIIMQGGVPVVQAL